MSDELLQTKPIEDIRNRIYIIRCQRVMFDKDLAYLYGVETRILIQAVKRNIEKFPIDFMYQLSQEEFEGLRSQIVILEKGRGKFTKYLPYAFTEQGIAMLSGVLSSPKAIKINIQIMREFVAMRHYLSDKNELAKAIIEKFDKSFNEILMAFSRVLEEKAPLVSIGNNSHNNRISVSDKIVERTIIVPIEVYSLLQKIIEELAETELPSKAKKKIATNSKLLGDVIKEDKPSARRIRDVLLTIKATLEIAAVGNSLLDVILKRITQTIKLLS